MLQDVVLERVVELPAQLAATAAEARAEGYRFLDRLLADWATGALRFDRPGEVLLTAACGGALAGVGGLTVEPVFPAALRMRRFYIRPPFRRSGIGRALVAALLEATSPDVAIITVNAASGSEAFWERCGFQVDPRDGHTHVLRRQNG